MCLSLIFFPLLHYKFQQSNRTDNISVLPSNSWRTPSQSPSFPCFNLNSFFSRLVVQFVIWDFTFPIVWLLLYISDFLCWILYFTGPFYFRVGSDQESKQKKEKYSETISEDALFCVHTGLKVQASVKFQVENLFLSELEKYCFYVSLSSNCEY